MHAIGRAAISAINLKVQFVLDSVYCNVRNRSVVLKLCYLCELLQGRIIYVADKFFNRAFELWPAHMHVDVLKATT